MKHRSLRHLRLQHFCHHLKNSPCTSLGTSPGTQPSSKIYHLMTSSNIALERSMDKSPDTSLVTYNRHRIPVINSITIPSKFEPSLNLVSVIFNNRQLQILDCQIKSYFATSNTFARHIFFECCLARSSIQTSFLYINLKISIRSTKTVDTCSI